MLLHPIQMKRYSTTMFDEVPEGDVTPKWGKLLKAEEVAVYLRCHVSTVYDLIGMRRLKALSLKGRIERGKRGKKGIRVLADSVNEFVSSGLDEFAEAGRPEQPPAEPNPAPALPPPLTGRPPKDSVGSSRVVLPFPGRSR
jgi:excisionase family DNA binding protein